MGFPKAFLSNPNLTFVEFRLPLGLPCKTTCMFPSLASLNLTLIPLTVLFLSFDFRYPKIEPMSPSERFGYFPALTLCSAINFGNCVSKSLPHKPLRTASTSDILYSSLAPISDFRKLVIDFVQGSFLPSNTDLRISFGISAKTSS